MVNDEVVCQNVMDMVCITQHSNEASDVTVIKFMHSSQKTSAMTQEMNQVEDFGADFDIDLDSDLKWPAVSCPQHPNQPYYYRSVFQSQQVHSQLQASWNSLSVVNLPSSQS